MLVIEWLDGVSLRAAAQRIEDRGLDRAALSRALLRPRPRRPRVVPRRLLELVTRAGDIDELLLERALGQFMARHLTGGTAATPEMFTDLFRLASRYKLVIQPEIATVLRALGTLEARSPC